MRYKLKRAVSLLLSAVLAMSGVGNLITVSAEEMFSDVENVTEVTNLEQQEMKYSITLPYYEEYSYLFDQEHLVESMEEQVSEEKKDIVLSYAADEKVEIILVQNGNADITEVNLLDQEKEELPYEWKEKNHMEFVMPAKDLFLEVLFAPAVIEMVQTEPLQSEIIQTEPQQTERYDVEANITQETEDISIAESVTETESSNENPEVSDEKSTETVTASPEKDVLSEYETENTVQKEEIIQDSQTEHESDTKMESDKDDIETESGTAVEIPDMENDTLPETEPESSSAYQEETEQDGLPLQGSIVQVEAITIPFDTWEFDQYKDFRNIPYDLETCSIEYISDDIIYDVLGLYSSIYRVTDKESGKFWFVLRPIQVSEAAEESEVVEEIPEQITEAGSEEADSRFEVPSEGVQSETNLIWNDEVLEEQTEDTADMSTENPDEMDTEEAETTEVVEGSENPESYSVYLLENSDVAVMLNQEVYEAGESVTVLVNPMAGYQVTDLDVQTCDDTAEELTQGKTVMVEEMLSGNDSEDEVQIDTESEIESGEVKERAYTFTMPESDVLLSVESVSEVMELSVAAEGSEENEDPVPDKFKLVNTGTMAPLPSSYQTYPAYNYAATQIRKVVFYDEDGNAVTRRAYCIQPNLDTPPGGTYDKNSNQVEILETGTKEKNLAKCLYYMYGGPAWGKTIEYADGSGSVNLKDLLDKKGCTTNNNYFAVTHYVLGYFYVGAGGDWNANSGMKNVINSTGEAAIKSIAEQIKKLPVPKTELSEVSVVSSYNSGSGVNVSGSIKYKAIDENTATITLPQGITLVNETTGERSTGTATIHGGTKFHLEATSDISGTGYYTLKCKYAVDFTAMALKTSGKQDIGFSYYSGDKNLTFTVAWEEVPMDKPIELQKYDLETGKAMARGKGATFAGAEYSVYADAACSTLVEVLITDTSGYTKSSSLPIATYYVKETKAPIGYELDPTVYSIEMSRNDGLEVYVVSSKEQIKKEYIELQKVEKSAEMEKAVKQSVSFAGAQYVIYADAACTQAVETLTTDANGYAKSSGLLVSTYYVKETKAPVGYLLDENVYTVDMSHTDALAIYPVTSAEEEIREKIEVRKADLETGASKPFNSFTSFEGAEYTIYADAGCKEVVEVLRTDTDGYAASSDLSVRTYYVKETKAPKGYLLDETVYTVTMNHTDDLSVYPVTSLEQVIRKPIEIQKVDKETGLSKPQNTAVSFAGAEYTIYAEQNCSSAIETLITDESGWAKSSDLPVGIYYVKETKPPKGYLADETLYTVTVGDDNKSVYRIDSMEQVIRGSLSVMKFLDDSYDGSILQDRVESGILSDICFILQHEDKTVPVVKIVTDKYGHAKTDKYALVYGTWYITEDPDTIPEGYEGISDAEVFISEEETDLHYVVSNNQPASQIKLIKKDAHTKNEVSISGGKFQIIDSKGNSVTMPDPLNYAKLTDTFVLDENGMIYFTNALKAGDYRIQELEAPEGYLVGSDIRFSVTENRDYLNPMVIEFEDEPQMGNIRIKKMDKETGKSLGTGFVFEIYAAEDITDGSGAIRTVEKEGQKVELKKGTLVDVIETDGNGIAETENMYLGKYLVKEKIAGEHYAVSQMEYPVSLAADRKVVDVTAEVLVENEKTRLELLKVDASEETVTLEGIRFRIYSSLDVEKEKAVQIAEAVEKLRMEQNPRREAFLTQQMDALAYFDAEEHTEEERLNFLSVQKKELEAFDDGLQKERDALEAQLREELQVTDVSGLGTEYITDKDGRIVLEDLKHGCTFFVYETGTLPGYNLDTAVYEFTVDADGLIDGKPVYSLKIANQPNELEITKMDITKEKELPGATLTIKDSEGNIVESWVSAEEPHRIKGLSAGTYTLIEEQAPEGYAIAESITFELTDSLQVQQVVMYDDLIKLAVSKKDITGDNELPGAKLTITDMDGNEVEEWTSAEEPHMVNLPVGTYILTEVAAPDKYATAESIEFTVNDDLSIQQVTMYDAPIQVCISKKDITGDAELPGALLTITDEEGNVVEEWISAEEPHMVNLAVGIYTLTEIAAPEKYARAESIVFEVKDSMEVQQVVMYDKPIEVCISKKDITNDAELPGAQLTITDEKGNVVEEWISAEEPHMVNLAAGMYTLTEIAAPETYSKAESIVFEVTDAMEVQYVVMYDKPIEVSISKKDITNDEELPGAQLIVKDKDGKTKEEWISTEEPHLMNLPIGTYTLTEVTAPDGYDVAETITFEVTDTMEVQQVVMYDAPKEETVDLTGKEDTTTTTTGGDSSPHYSGTTVTAAPVRTGDDNSFLLGILLVIGGMFGLTAVVAGKKQKKK